MVALQGEEVAWLLVGWKRRARVGYKRANPDLDSSPAVTQNHSENIRVAVRALNLALCVVKYQYRLD